MTNTIKADDIINAVVARNHQNTSYRSSPELARMPKGKEKLHGLSRSYLYALEKAGLIRTVSVVMPGKARGIRLVDVSSVRAFFNTQVPASHE